MSSNASRPGAVVAAPRVNRTIVTLGEETSIGAKAEFDIAFTPNAQMHARFAALDDVAAEGAARELFEQVAARSAQRAETYPQSVEAQVEAGFAALVSGDSAGARAAFERSLLLDGSHRSARLGLARALVQLDDIAGATALLARLLADHPLDTEALVSLAIIRAQQEGVDAALSLLEGVAIGSISSPQRAAELLATRGSLNLMGGRTTLAISDLRKAVRLRSDWVHARTLLGVAEAQAGHLLSGERRLQEAMRIGPLSQEPLEEWLRLMIRERRYEDILGFAKRDLSARSASAIMARAVGIASFETGQISQAREWYLVALEKNPDNALKGRLQNDIGVVFSLNANHERAAQWFLESFTTLPSELSALNYAKALLANGNAPAAVAWLQRVGPDQGLPMGFEHRKLLTQAFWAARDLNGAAAAATFLLSDPNADADAFALASMLFTDGKGDYKAGVDAARLGMKRYPDSEVLANNLAYALLMDGDSEAAEAVLGRFSDVSDDVKDTWLATLGLLALRRGHVDEGRQAYEMALRHAAGDGMRARIRAKRDLEVARATLAIGGDAREARRLLERAAREGQESFPYGMHAQAALRLLGSGERIDQLRGGTLEGSAGDGIT